MSRQQVAALAEERPRKAGVMSARGGEETQTRNENTLMEKNPKAYNKEFVRKLTPRSRHACRMLGVLPTELVKREYKSFYHPGISSEIQKLRFQDYEQTRLDTLAMAREQRAEIIEQVADGYHSGEWELQKERDSPIKRKPINDSSVAQIEKMRMEKILRQQNKELEAMMSYEMTMATMMAKQEKKMAIRKKKEAERTAQMVLKRLEKEAKQREREETKKKIQRLKFKEEKARAKAQYDAEQLRIQQNKQEEKRAARQAKKNAAEAEAKRIENEKRHADILEQRRLEAEDRQREMDMRELHRQQRMLADQQKQAAINRARREEQAQRHAKVQQQKEEALEKQRLIYSHKMALQQARRADFEYKKNEEFLKNRKVYKEKEQVRQQKFNNAKRKEEARVRAILERQVAHDESLMKLEFRRQQDQAYKQEMRDLNLKRKQRNVARLRRQDEFQRAQLVAQVTSALERTDALEKQKAQLLLQRQRNKISALRQKQNLIRIFGQLKSNPNKWKALTAPIGKEENDGQGGGGMLQGPSSRPHTMSRSQSAAVINTDALRHLLAQAEHETRSPPRKKNMRRAQSQGAGMFLTQRDRGYRSSAFD